MFRAEIAQGRAPLQTDGPLDAPDRLKAPVSLGGTWQEASPLQHLDGAARHRMGAPVTAVIGSQQPCAGLEIGLQAVAPFAPG